MAFTFTVVEVRKTGFDFNTVEPRMCIPKYFVPVNILNNICMYNATISIITLVSSNDGTSICVLYDRLRYCRIKR